MSQEGQTAYFKNLEDTSFGDSALGSKLIAKAIRRLTEDIEIWKSTTRVTKMKFISLRALPSIDLAYIALKVVLDQCFKNLCSRGSSTSKPVSLNVLCLNVGKQVTQHHDFFMFYNDGNYKKLHEWVVKRLNSSSSSHRHKCLKWFRSLNKQKPLYLDKGEKIYFGYRLVELVIKSTGLVELIHEYVAGKRYNIVYPSNWVLNKLEGITERDSLMCPLKLPMVIPPKPWTSWDDGGYLGFRHKFVGTTRTINKILFHTGSLNNRILCANYLGNVPWEIHRELLEIASEAYRIQDRSVPNAEIEVNLPPKPWADNKEYSYLKAHNPEVIKEWKEKAAKVYSDTLGSRARSLRVAFLRQKMIAETMKPYEKIYFPHRIDYRGRYYPLPVNVNPQANDFGKAIIRFYQKTPIEGITNEYKYYGAGLMGVDKCSLSDRLKFINENENEILAAAEDPLRSNFWKDADKPWCMLAYCLEYAKIKKGQRYTQIPMGLDGSCNGLQHLSAAIRDEKGGALVNLDGYSDVPADIYTEVKKRVEELLPPLSPWQGKLSRKLVKRNTMTTPYNVTKFGMREQLEDELKQSSDTGKLDKNDLNMVNELVMLNSQAIDESLPKARELMQWYTKVVSCFLEKGLKPTWTLPDGFKVIQDLPKYIVGRINLERGRKKLDFRKVTDVQDSRHSKAAFSPNVTHSMDATHMTQVILRAIERGKNTPFSAVHDSFGVPCSTVDVYEHIIKQEFYNLYNSFDIISELQRTYYEATGEALPDAPKIGNLDIAKILDSRFAFQV